MWAKIENWHRVKRLAGPVALVIASTFVGFGLMELGLRIVGYSVPVFMTYEDLRAFALVPGKQGWYRKEGNAYFRINSHGYRGPDFSVEKRDNVIRIAVLGDSMVEARQVNFADTAWQRLERLVPTCSDLSGKKLQVLNFGVGGYGTTQELLTFRRDVLRFQPDIVFLVVTTFNDIRENSIHMARAGRASLFRPFAIYNEGKLEIDYSFRTATFGNLKNKIMLLGIHYSRVLELINQARRTIDTLRMLRGLKKNRRKVGLSGSIYLPPEDPLWRDAWTITEAIVAQMNKEVVAAGAKFIVVTATSSRQVDPDPAKRKSNSKLLGVKDLFYPERRLREFSQRSNITLITLAEPLQAEAEKTGVYFHGFSNTALGTGHWNENGHEAVARVLANKLCSLGVFNLTRIIHGAP